MNEILKIAGLPVKARLQWVNSWDITTSQDGSHLVLSASRTARGEYREVNQAIVRDSFLAISSPEEAVSCFRRFGPFQRDDHDDSKFDTQRETAKDLQFEALVQWQDSYRGFIETPSPDCFESQDIEQELMHAVRPTFTVEMGHVRLRETKHPAPYLQQISRDVQSAVYSSIYIDKMAGLRGGICAECSKVFISSSDKPRRFCSSKCGANNRQARLRDRKKLAEATNG